MMLYKVLNLIDEKLKILKLFIFITIGAAIELLSVGSMFPALFLLIDNPNNFFIDKFFKIINTETLVIEENILPYFVLILLVSIFFIKFLYLVFLAYYQATIGNSIKLNISKKFLTKYLNANFEFHVENNSAILIRNIATEIEIFYKSVFVPLLICTMETIIFGGLIFFLFFYNPLGTSVIVVILILLLLIYYFLLKKKYSQWGQARQFYDGMKLKFLTQSLRFAKIIKLAEKENFFVNKYIKHFYNAVNLSKKFNTMYVFPRQFLEFFLVLSLVIISIYFINKGHALNTLFETLSVYVIVAYRLIPSANKLAVSFQSISTGKVALDKLNEIQNSKLNSDLSSRNNLNLKKINFKNKIEIKKLNFSHKNGKDIFDSLDLIISKGEFIGIVGKSGSGKTTLVDILLGVYMPDSASIFIDGKEIDYKKKLNLNISYVPQDNFILDDNIVNNIALGIKRKDIDEKKLDEVIYLTKLQNLIDELPQGKNTILGENGIRLSGGQKQRLSIARAIYNDPEILIIDEATSGLDIENERSILEDLIKLKKLKTIILISHRKESMIFCDKIFEVKNKTVEQVK